MQQSSFVESDVTKNEVMFVWPGDAHAPSFLAISPSFWSDLKNSFRVEFSEFFLHRIKWMKCFPGPENFSGLGSSI